MFRETPYTILERKQRLSQLYYVMLSITPREERVLRLRLGSPRAEPQTFEEIGADWHLSRERIRQIEAKAIRKLQSRYRKRGLVKWPKPPPKPVYKPTKETRPLPEPPPRPYDDMPHDEFLAELEDRRIMPPGYRVLTAFWQQWGLKMASREDDWLYDALRKWQHELSGQLERALREAYEAGRKEGEDGEKNEEKNVHLTAVDIAAGTVSGEQDEQEQEGDDDGEEEPAVA